MRMPLIVRVSWIAFVVVVATFQSEAAEQKTVLIELDGTASSDPDGDHLSYRWRQVDGPTVALSDVKVAKPYFRTKAAGKYVFELVVSDGKRSSQPARVEVLVERENIPPEAVVCEELSVELGQTIRIDGGRSRDVDGDRLGYHWRQAGGPPLYLAPQALSEAAFSFQPKKAGIYELELIVSDGKSQSRPARCRVLVSPPNKAPVARAVAVGKAVLDQASAVEAAAPADAAPIARIAAPDFVQAGDEVILDGSGSVSPGKKPLRYYWKQRSGPFVRAFDRSRNDVLRFHPEETGSYVFELVVSDGAFDSVAGVRTVRVTELNERPIAVIEAPSYAVIGAAVNLDGSKSFDKEGAALKYTWRQVAGPRVLKYVMTDPRGECVPAFNPLLAGTYEFELTVNDGQRDSRPARAVVEVQKGNRLPVARTAGNLSLAPGETVLLQGRGEDADGDSLTYAWRQISGPVLLNGIATQQSVTLKPYEEGVYNFQLMVSDGNAESAPATCRLEVKRGASVLEGEEEMLEDICAAEVLVYQEESDALLQAKAEPQPKARTVIEPTEKKRTFLDRFRIFQKPVAKPVAGGEPVVKQEQPDISTSAGPDDMSWLD